MDSSIAQADARQAPLQHSADECRRRTTLTRLLRDEFVDVRSDRFVESELFVVDFKGDASCMAVWEKPFAIKIFKIFFQPP